MPEFTGEYLLEGLYILNVLKAEIFVHHTFYLSDRTRFGSTESIWVNSKLLGDVYLRLHPESFEAYGHGSILAIYRKFGDRLEEKK